LINVGPPNINNHNVILPMVIIAESPIEC